MHAQKNSLIFIFRTVPALAVDTEGLRLLNRTNPEDFYPLNGSDPANPTYGGVAEVFHQLHCLVRCNRNGIRHNASNPFLERYTPVYMAAEALQ